MTTPDTSPLDQAIALLQGFRGPLGDAAVDAAIAALRQRAPPAAGGPQGVRLRQVSVLFADVAGSTAMLGRVGTEDAQDLLGSALQHFADAVHRWGGQVLRYTGDGIKAAFGMQGVAEDQAERAVRAGLQILDEAARHAGRVQRELGIEGFGVRVGIHTGPVLLGGGPEAERTAMGQAVHLAARMEQSAPVGRLRISDASWALVRGLFEAESQPPLQIKGHDEPLRTWLVKSVAAGPEPTVQRGVGGGATPMIGRDAELDRLAALHAQGLATGAGSLATVLAEAGIGKTRLRLALLQRLGLAEGDAGLLQARAHPSSGLQPYGLLRQLLARWLAIDDDAPAEAARQRLVQGLAPWLGPQAAVLAPRIGQLIGLDFAQHPAVQALSAATLRTQAFDALRAALQARAAHTPLLLVLDDLHWADEASLDFVRTLLPPAPVPLMLMLLARPALLERGQAFEPPPGLPAVALRLLPLDAAQGAALLDSLLAPLPDAPASLRDLLLQRAEGNPFYLEALVRMLIDDGVIDAGTHPWRLHAGRLAALRVPPTLVGVLQARLDSLPAADLLALQQASIVGPVFWDEALAAVDPQAPAALPALVRRALVQPRAASAFAQTAERAFGHALLHEVTYATLLKAPRRAGHGAVARWLAERVGQRATEFLAITAEHHERAGDSAQALEFWDLAQVDAYARYANPAALAFIERALAQPALTDARWRFSLMAAQHEVLERLGRTADATALAARMQDWADACDDDAMRADLTATRMLVADHQGRSDEAQRLARQALALAARADASAAAAAAVAHGELAWLATLRHDHATVEAEVRAGLVQARIAAAVPRRQLGYSGYPQQLQAIAIEALLQQDRHVDVLAAVAQGLAEVGGAVQDRFNLLSRRCRAERLLGRLAEAEASAAEVQALADATGIARLRVNGLQQRAELALLGAVPDGAAGLVAEADRLVAAFGLSTERPVVLELQGRLAGRCGDADAARALWRSAIPVFEAQQRAVQAAQLRCELAWLDWQAGDTGAAREAVEVALAFAAQDTRPHRRLIAPEALLAAHAVLAAGGDARAVSLRADLRARLDEQLSALPDAAARERLLAGVPHWRAVQALA